MSYDLRHGDYATVMQDVRADCLITDAPYSARTHTAHDQAVSDTRGDVSGSGNECNRRAIEYTAWTPTDVQAFADFWCPRIDGWMVSITDHHLAPVWAEAFESHGLYAFSPLAFVHPGSRVRLAGDGPAQWSVWIVVARPRKAPYSKWGSLPGAYVMPKDAPPEPKREIGGKPEWLMRELVKDYSRPGDLICDPCAGWSSTGVAALQEHRRFVGSEVREEAYKASLERLSKPVRVSLFVDVPKPEQLSLVQPTP